MAQILSITTNMTDRVQLQPQPNQVAICEPIVYLEAAVIGDLSRHLFEWVQISGTPTVDLQVVSPTQVYYTVPGASGTDKVFRFYVDRNTHLEQHLDVTVYTTPATDLVPFEVGEGWSATDYPAVAKINTNRIYFAADFDYTIPDNAHGEFITTGLVMQLPLPEWQQLPADPDASLYAGRYVSLVTQQWTGSTWVDVATFLPADPRELAVTLPARLRFGGIYAKTGTGHERIYSPWIDYSGGALTGDNVVIPFEVGELWNHVTMTRLVYVLVPLNPDAVADQWELGEGWNDVTFQRIAYVLESQTHDITIDQMEVGELTNTFTITRVAGGSLGG